MDLKCPKCSSEDTRKLTLLMSQGGTMEKSAQLGVSYFSNIGLPMMTVFIALMLGVLFAFMNPIVGLIVFVGVVYGGFALRKRIKNKTKSKYADLSPAMKQNGFQCNRCENLFIPA
jgi:hypothetical protein